MFHIFNKSVLQKARQKDGSYQHASMLEVEERPKTLCAFFGMWGCGRNIISSPTQCPCSSINSSLEKRV